MRARLVGGWRALRHESWIYLGNCLVTLTPGFTPPYVRGHTVAPGDVRSWPSDDQHRLIDEARRQLDQQRVDLERIQTRSQFLFTTGLGLLALAAFAQDVVRDSDGCVAWAVWLLGALLMILGVWGAAANLAAKNVLGTIDAVLLSRAAPPTLGLTAQAYAEQIRPGFDTVATRLVVYRDAVCLVFVSVLLFLIAWYIAR